jgi:diaminobutyrate-2-oxoglutarate transaminase
LEIFDRLESEVRGYIRSFPVVFETARATTLTTSDGREYLDFFAGAGVLNYGHNNPVLKQPLLDYINRDGITHSLDLATSAKKTFMETFEARILKPRSLHYKIQFTGPTGTDAVEAALKLARLVTGRSNVVAFTNAFHGVSTGALAATGNTKFREAAGFPLAHITRLPYDRYLGDDVDTMDLFAKLLDDPGSGMDLPAAVIVELIQGEGGINAARLPWIRRLREITEDHGILLIVDDIQAGVGRSGQFFSFEAPDIVPDIVCVSKSLSAYGLPFAIVLMKPEFDVWQPAAHTGTFRGNNLAFVTATAALEHYWADDAFQRDVASKAEILRDELLAIIEAFPDLGLTLRGRGFMLGLTAVQDPTLAGRISHEAFERGLLIETSGPRNEVLKFLIALTIEEGELRRGVGIIRDSITALTSHDDVQTSAQALAV